MIILRKLGRQSDCRFVMADELIGATDGVNQTFAVSYEYTSGKIEIIYNGQVLTSPADFDEYGADVPTASGLEPNEIRFVYLKPTDISVLRANYQIGNCAEGSEDGPGGGGAYDFLNLEDTPSDYTGQAGKAVVVNNAEDGLSFLDFPAGSTNFIELTDTPTTYSGFENHYLRVNATGDGIDFVLPGGDTEEGITNIPIGATSVDVTFSNAFDNDNYILTVSLENKIDAEPSVYPALIKNKTVNGFTTEFSGDIDTDNYHLNWRATLPGSGPPGAGGSGISAVSEDSSPELGGHLDVGDHLLLHDPSPNGLSSHGYEIGASGDASLMTVFDNPTGYACPLYMRSDGKWGPCTAVSGTTQMPCAALALEEDDGLKKIFWKGNIRKGNWSWTPGDRIYVSTVEGAITNVKPNGGSWPQVIGIAISSDTIRFDPDLTTENPNGGN